ncbi:unnamed protein product [Spirodela intermedia]|uniref:RRM domain-containing protein n=1 Tax=Spirodela intermedia TaxID=51605 RepID=A0A7I8IAS2_SPIIN|nr:unnamed protein product [Spirodela intermedia]CAA6654132.1 unnamed protein product [Spirodela intermedia]
MALCSCRCSPRFPTIFPQPSPQSRWPPTATGASPSKLVLGAPVAAALGLHRQPLPATSRFRRLCALADSSPKGQAPGLPPAIVSSSKVAMSYTPCLPSSTSEGSLVKTFSQFGDVTRVKVITSKVSKQSLGFAYVWFELEEDAQVAVEEMNGKVSVRRPQFIQSVHCIQFFDGRYIHVAIADSESPTKQAKAIPYRF